MGMFISENATSILRIRVSLEEQCYVSNFISFDERSSLHVKQIVDDTAKAIYSEVSHGVLLANIM